MNGHVFAEGGDLFGEGVGGFGVEAADPEIKRVAGGGEEALPLLGGEFVGEEDWGELGGVENLVGVGVADAREDARVGEGPLEGAVFQGESRAEGFEVRGEDLDSAWIYFFCGGFIGEEIKRGSALGAGFGEDEGAVGKVEGGEVVAASEFRVEGAPMEAAGDHEMKDEPEAVVELEDDSLADAVEGADGVVVDFFDVWMDGAEEEGAGDAEVSEWLAYDAWGEGGEIGGDVGKFRHVFGEMITVARWVGVRSSLKREALAMWMSVSSWPTFSEGDCTFACSLLHKRGDDLPESDASKKMNAFRRSELRGWAERCFSKCSLAGQLPLRRRCTIFSR